MSQPVTKAIIPAAGLGTRFLPQTKAMPKEMLPIIDKPVIQHVVEEVVAAGVTDVIIVTGSHKRAIEDHFDRSIELEESLMSKEKDKEAEQIRNIAEMANFVYVRQKGFPQGNALPVINAQHLLSEEPFFVLFPDDLFKTNGRTRAEQLLEAYHQTGTSVITLIDVEPEAAERYGMAEIVGDDTEEVMQVRRLVEKPGPDNTPSHLASVGGYLLTPDALPAITDLAPDTGGELVLADAINRMAQQGKVHGCRVDGTYHDTGNKQRYLEAMVDMALQEPELAEDFADFLRRVIDNGN